MYKKIVSIKWGFARATNAMVLHIPIFHNEILFRKQNTPPSKKIVYYR